MTHLILEASELDQWRKHHSGGLLVPEARRPVVLQPSREAAESEALRLAQRLPHGMFVLFAPVALAKRLPEVTHVNIRGEPLQQRNVVRLVKIGGTDQDWDIPF
jgi:hypothetical protein